MTALRVRPLLGTYNLSQKAAWFMMLCISNWGQELWDACLQGTAARVIECQASAGKGHRQHNKHL